MAGPPMSRTPCCRRMSSRMRSMSLLACRIAWGSRTPVAARSAAAWISAIKSEGIPAGGVSMLIRPLSPGPGACQGGHGPEVLRPPHSSLHVLGRLDQVLRRVPLERALVEQLGPDHPVLVHHERPGVRDPLLLPFRGG